VVEVAEQVIVLMVLLVVLAVAVQVDLQPLVVQQPHQDKVMQEEQEAVLLWVAIILEVLEAVEQEQQEVPLQVQTTLQMEQVA
jgi:hypothetical protein